MYKDIPFFKVNKNKYLSKKKVLVIGEIGSNHNNDYNLALRSIDAAVNAKCDAVKFQLFKADKIIQRKSPGWKILKKLELNESWIPKLKRYCRNKRILFSISVFDLNGLNVVNKYGIDFYKIASPELEDLPLISAISKLKKPTIISTGAANLSAISQSVEVFRKNFNNNFALLHCISNYPTSSNELNLDMIKSLQQSFGVPVGFSDHSNNIYSSIIATANGACIIEKHITLNKKLNGPDHHFALEPLELKAMVEGIRVSEKAFKNFIKQPVTFKESSFSRKIVSNKNLKKNHRITLKDLITKRVKKPHGIKTFDIEKIIGLRLSKSIKKDDELNWNSFK